MRKNENKQFLQDKIHFVIAKRNMLASRKDVDLFNSSMFVFSLSDTAHVTESWFLETTGG